MQVLARVKALLDAGNTRDQVNDLLRLEDFPEEPETLSDGESATEAPASATSANTAIMALTGAIVQDQAQRVAALEHQVADLRVQVATLVSQLETHRHRSRPFGGETTGPI